MLYATIARIPPHDESAISAAHQKKSMMRSSVSARTMPAIGVGP
jgi:hypothetical protein